MTTDPAGQYWSLYLGMGNNPVSNVDPDGRNDDNIIHDSKNNTTDVVPTKDNFDNIFIDGNPIVQTAKGNGLNALNDVLKNEFVMTFCEKNYFTTWDIKHQNRFNGLDNDLKTRAITFINYMYLMESVKLRVGPDGGFRNLSDQNDIWMVGRSDLDLTLYGIDKLPCFKRFNVSILRDTRPILTKAKPGESLHNFGLAVDLYDIPSMKPLSPHVGGIGENFGLKWGGRFKGSFTDPPHFQINKPH